MGWKAELELLSPGGLSSAGLPAVTFTGNGYLVRCHSLPQIASDPGGEHQTDVSSLCAPFFFMAIPDSSRLCSCSGAFVFLAPLPLTHTLYLHSSFAVRPSLAAVWASGALCSVCVIMECPTLRARLRLDLNPSISYSAASVFAPRHTASLLRYSSTQITRAERTRLS